MLHLAKSLRNNSLSLAPYILSPLRGWISHIESWSNETFHTDLFSSSVHAALNIPVIPPTYSDKPVFHAGHEILNIFFDKALEKNKDLFAFGEDVGKLGM